MALATCTSETPSRAPGSSGTVRGARRARQSGAARRFEYARGVLALLLALAAALSPAQHLQRGEAALSALEYETAAYELMLAATDPAATDAQKLRANLLAGIAHRVLGRDLDARLNFRYLLLRAPDTRLVEDPSPKVQLFFESVRQEVEAERASREPAPTPPPAASSPAAPAAPPPSTSVVAGAVVGGLGVVALLGGGGALAFAETSLADPARPGAERTELRTLGMWSAAAAGTGLVLAAAGGVLLGLGLGSDPS